MAINCPTALGEGGNVALAEEWPNELMGVHKKLYKYIERQVQDFAPMTKLVEKDVLMSGVRYVFGKERLDLIKTERLQTHISNPMSNYERI
ncbi:hypothetical protein BGZ88_003968 [Linnemannia elongata]|nr:hypothetical protein BGZ88_003968 [Linnemannia elongata]